MKEILQEMLLMMRRRLVVSLRRLHLTSSHGQNQWPRGKTPRGLYAVMAIEKETLVTLDKDCIIDLVVEKSALMRQLLIQ